MTNGNWAYLALTAVLFACDGQQYVSPDTALLTISDAKTGTKLLERCNYVPVLLGGRVEQQYVVDPTLRASLELTRSDLVVTFDSDSDTPEPFHVTKSELESSTRVVDDHAPSGYAVALSLACVPDATP